MGELSDHQFSPARTSTLFCPEATPEVPLMCSWCGLDFTSHQHFPPDPNTCYLTLLVPHMAVEKPSLTQFHHTHKPQKRGEPHTAPVMTWASLTKHAELEESSGRSNPHSFTYTCSICWVSLKSIVPKWGWRGDKAMELSIASFHCNTSVDNSSDFFLSVGAVISCRS